MSKTIAPKEGSRVRFEPTAASLSLYSAAPKPGAVGSVVAIPVGGRKVTLLPGPGGGLVYVEWDGIGVMGVGPGDVKPAGDEKHNPVLTTEGRGKLRKDSFADPDHRRFPIHDREHAVAAPGKLNLLYKRGQITKAEYREYYARMMKAFGRFGLTAHKPPLVAPASVSKKPKEGSKPSGDKLRRNPAVPAESKPGLKKAGAGKRHLPVLSPEWRKERSSRILKRNPGGSRNDPNGMRALLLQAISKPNPVAIRENVNLSTRMMIPNLALEAASLETNLSSIDPMEYYDAFLAAGTSPDTAAARMEEMASWGVTDKV